jgi:riboflavin kinase / FMN adenylyltransferase
MKLYRGLEQIGQGSCAVLTIGSFDGVHIGHQQLISQTIIRAGTLGCHSGVLSFDPLPRQILGKSKTHYLTTLEEKVDLVRQIGPDSMIILPFNAAMSEQTPEDFISMLQANFRIKELWMGERFAMGKNRAGTPKRLAEIGRERGFDVHICPSVKVDGQIVSSTAVRQLISAGNLEQATKMLGRYHWITGKVVPGDQRGRELGFPTANIECDPLRAVPGNGVYAVLVEHPGSATHKMWPGVMNIGTRPSFGGGNVSLEVHVLDFEGDLYEHDLRIFFVHRLRPETKFENTEALQKQISADIQTARRVIAGAQRPSGIGPVSAVDLPGCKCTTDLEEIR